MSLLLEEGQPTVRAWARIGECLDEIERTQVWRDSASSFTAWMSQTAPLLGLKDASLWRFLRSFRIYGALRKEMASSGYELPEVFSLPSRVSAELVELFEKLRRVAPRDVTDPMVPRLVRGDLSRAEVRTLWMDYRPALGGRTARGHGISRAPRVREQDPQVEQALADGAMLVALREGDRTWTRLATREVYEVFRHVEILEWGMPAERWPGVVPAVVAVRENERAKLQFHAFKVVLPAQSGDVRDACDRWHGTLSAYVDFTWVVLAGSDPQMPWPLLPEEFGVASLQDGQLHVVQYPTDRADSPPRSGDLAKQLLSVLLLRSSRADPASASVRGA